ncbi:MAG TPA: response regulator [Bacteroidales bacterium]|nr:response regulator [Bacteroidales bacterium]HPS16731.1 response regulator [Bacteroidales bacterium]
MRAIKKVVLVADENFLSSYLISKYICKADHSVIWTQNGLEAVKMCEINPEIDLVIMNVSLSELSGVEAAHRIKELRCGLPVVLHSASNRICDFAANIDCDDFINKQVDKEIIIGIINKYLNTNGDIKKILRVLS